MHATSLLQLVSALKFLLLGLLREVLFESPETKPNGDPEQQISFVLNKLRVATGSVLNATTPNKTWQSFLHLRGLNRVGWGVGGRGV